MVHTHPLCSLLPSPSPSTFHNRKFSSFSTSCRYLKFPNKYSPFITNCSFQNPSAKLQHPDEKSSPLLKRLHYKDLRNSFLLKLAKTLNSCDPNENQVYEIIKGFGYVTARDAGFILNNMSKPDNALFVFRYFVQLFEPVKQVILYNVMLKLFRESMEFEKAEKLFDEMLQRMVKPNVITFSTMISCATLCSKYHKAVEWFEIMPSFECEPDDYISSSMISSYACIGNVDMALTLYRRAEKEKWKLGKTVFLSLIKMYGKSANYDGCLSVYGDMKVFGVKPNLRIYNNMLYAMGKGKRTWEVKAIYEEMINNGISPNQFTYETVLEAYCSGDVGCADEAIEIFQDMKSSGTCHPDRFTYTSLISMYSRIGKVSEAEAMLNEMMNCGFEPNILVLTSLTSCYGKAKRTDDVVRIFNQLLDLGISPDDRFCDCLLYVMTQLPKQEHGKITDCIQKANPKLGFVVRYLMEERDGDGNFRKEASELFNSVDDFVIKKSMCDSLIDLCVNMNQVSEIINGFEDNTSKVKHPDAKSSPLFKNSFQLKLAKTLDSCDPNENQVSENEIINGFEDNALKLKHPDAKSPPLFNYSFLLKLAKTLDSCDPNENQVSEIIFRSFDCNVTELNACFILNNMSKADNAILVFRYFTQMFEPVKLVFLYSVMLKLFRENREFEKAEKLFDEMLQRMVKPNVITFSAMISCATLCSKYDKAVEWFVIMPSFECEPNEYISSSMISSYACIGNVDMALRLYRRAKKEKWKLGKMVFLSLIKMYGKSANYDGCLSVYRDMKVFGVKPNLTIYNNMLCAMERSKRAWEVKAIYEEMINNGISPNQFTYETVLEAYCSGDVGFADEAIEIFQDMKSSGTCHPDSFTYTSLISMYSRTGKVSEAEAMLNEMMNCGFEPNILVLTSLTSCYGKAKRTDDVVRIFNQLLDLGISPDDRFCYRLLSVMTHLPKQEHGKITDCIQKANPKLGFVVRYLMEERDGDGNFRKEASELFNSVDDFFIKKSMCDSLIDLCVNMEVPDRAHDLLNLGLTLGIYSNRQNRSQTKWSLYVKSLPTGTALTALHVWINDLSKALESGEELPPVLGIYTGTRKNKPSSVIESYLIEHNAPFQKDNDMAGWFLTTSEAAKPWLQS